MKLMNNLHRVVLYILLILVVVSSLFLGTGKTDQPILLGVVLLIMLSYIVKMIRDNSSSKSK